MKLHFPWPAVKQALAAIRAAGTVRTLYDQDTGKGFWLVGDQGVYLMPNTTDAQPVIYARECDPVKLDFDVWWQNKRASFGTDDGVEFLSIESILKFSATLHEKPKFLVIDLEEDKMSLSIY